MEVSDLIAGRKHMYIDLASCPNEKVYDGNGLWIGFGHKILLEIVPNCIEEITQLLYEYALPSVTDLVQNDGAYMIVVDRSYNEDEDKDIAYIDLINLQENIRNRNINKIINESI